MRANQKMQLKVILKTWSITALFYLIGTLTIGYLAQKNNWAGARLSPEDFAKGIEANIALWTGCTLAGLIPLLLIWFGFYKVWLKNWNFLTPADRLTLIIPTFLLFPFLGLSSALAIVKLLEQILR